MRNNPLRQLRDSRIRALKSGEEIEPVAFFWDDPELLTDDAGEVVQIWFNDVIDDWYGISSAMIVEALLAADGRDVLVHLNSPGGMVFEGMAIHSAFKQHAGKVTMRVEGLAASAASFVMLAADEVIIEPSAMVMIHDAWDFTVGPASEHRKTADVLDKVSDNIAGMYAAKSGGEVAQWRTAMLEETWYTGAEAVNAGLADRLADDDAELDDRAVAATRWSGIFAKGQASLVRMAAVQPEPIRLRRDQLPDSAPAAQRFAVSLLDVNAIATQITQPGSNARVIDATPKTEPTEPDWWVTLQNGLKGVRK